MPNTIPLPVNISNLTQEERARYERLMLQQGLTGLLQDWLPTRVIPEAQGETLDWRREPLTVNPPQDPLDWRTPKDITAPTTGMNAPRWYLLTYSYYAPVTRYPHHTMVLTQDWLATLIKLRENDKTVAPVFLVGLTPDQVRSLEVHRGKWEEKK